MPWYAVSTLPRQEQRAELNLRRQDYEVWLPRMARGRRHARRFDIVKVPLFPGYLFMRLDPERESWRSVNGTYGVRRLICFDGRPAQLPDAFIHALEDCVDEEGLVTAHRRDLQPGMAVRVVSGPFADQVGTLVALDGPQRVSLLLGVLGRQVSATVSASAVAPAA